VKAKMPKRKQKIGKLWSPVCLLLALVGQMSAVFASERLAESDNSFGFELLRELAKQQPGANICISPYDAATLLQLAGGGAAGSTQSEMKRVLQTTAMSVADMKSGARALSKSLAANGKVKFTSANALWYLAGAPVNTRFIADSQQFYGATVSPLDFLDSGAKDIINTWASEKTQGKIPRIVDGGIDHKTTLFLADAVYFKGKWSKPFQQRYTRSQTFHQRDGAEKLVLVMRDMRQWEYRDGDEYQAVRIPYEGDDLALYLILPAVGTSPEALLDKLSREGWQQTTNSGFTTSHVNLVLPRFKIEYGVDLSPALQALGMKTAFNAAAADFSLIAPGVFISAIRHKSYIDVDEEGTEAAAATAAGLSLGMPPKIIDMIIDRPFIFFVADRQADVILFMGFVFDPSTGASMERAR
jgi:serpin B